MIQSDYPVARSGSRASTQAPPGRYSPYRAIGLCTTTLAETGRTGGRVRGIMHKSHWAAANLTSLR